MPKLPIQEPVTGRQERDSQLGREGLEKHRYGACQHDDPQQVVAELCSRFDIRREIPGVHIRDGSDDRRTGEGQE